MDDLLLSGSVGYLLLSLATSGASQTLLLFSDREGSYPVGCAILAQRAVQIDSRSQRYIELRIPCVIARNFQKFEWRQGFAFEVAKFGRFTGHLKTCLGYFR